MRRFQQLRIWVIAALSLFMLHTQSNAQNVTYGFVQGLNPLEITAVAYPDFTSNDVTMVTSVFSFLLPEGTTTIPAIPIAPAVGNFNNITGSWDVQLITPTLYTNLGFNGADLQGNDVYQVVLQNSPILTNVVNGTPIELFSFVLPSDCLGGNVEVLTNNGAIQQSIVTNLFSNFNNQMSLSVNNNPAADTYNGNDPTTFSIMCPILNDLPDAVDDNVNVNGNTTTPIAPLVNDNFGVNGPGTQAILIVTPPVNGIATVDNNGTPNDPTDDTIDYTPNNGFAGTDQIVYQICDSNGDCDQATITINVTTMQNCIPTLQVFNASGAQITNGSSFTYTAPEGECGVQLIWTVFAFDNCGLPTLTSSISNPNPQVIPTAQLVQLNNAPTYALEIFAAVGTNTVTVTATALDGTVVTQTFTIEVPDIRLPEIYTPGNMNIEIPSCESDIPVNWTVSVVDDCDIQPTLIQTAGPISGASLVPGNYTVSYEATDDYGNTSTESFVISVNLAPSPAPIVDVSDNGQFNVPACEDDALVVFSGNVYDCDLTPFNFNAADLTVTTNALSPGASGAVAISYTLPQDGYVYFEATGNLTPGTYVIVTDYQGVSVDHGVIVTQDADQAATIDMPGNLSYLVPQCSAGADLGFAVQISDDCDTNLSGATFTWNGAAAPAIDAAASNPSAGLYVWNVSGVAAGSYTLGASYTDGAGNTSTSEVTFTVTGQPDTWAPLIVYPSQDINVDLDPCGPPTAVVTFEVTATDNCDGDLVPNVSATGGTIVSNVTNGGDTYVWTGGPGSYTVNISSTDAAGNTRTEDFVINITQDPAPLAALVCNDDINVTLDDNCQREIRADMVLEGEMGCLDNDDFVINIVNDDDPSNGNILDGCGEFIYEIDLNLPPAIDGFTSDYEASNWTVVEENDGTVTITPDVATLVSGNAGGCTNAESSMTIAAANDGTISFDYDYDTNDPGWEGHIIQVDANGNITTLVDVTGSAAGSINQSVAAGDVLYIAVVSVDCNFGSGTAEISNFHFEPAGIPFPVDFIGCWGYITGEDKAAPVIECPANTGTGTIVKNGYTLSGTIDTGDPQVVVNDWSCLIDNAQPSSAGTRYVDVQAFQVDENDIYTFLVQSDVTQTGNVGFAIYQGGYDVSNPCENIIAQSDIPQPPGVGNPLPGSQGNDPYVRLALPLQAGVTYYLATTTFTPDATGNYQYSICSDDDGQVGFFDTTYVTNPDWSVDEIVTFTPFPTSPVTIQLLLHCEDFDAIYNNPASLSITGSPTVSDNCNNNVDVTFEDNYAQNGDCGDIVITRTFTVVDNKGNTSYCNQLITLSPVIANDRGDSEVWLPPFTAPVECDEDFETLPNGHPTPAVTGYPFVFTISGIYDLNDNYCNVGASYEDGADIVVCDGAYKFIRTWTIVDWCNPIDFFTYSQLIKVGDFTPPTVGHPGEDYDWDGVIDPLVFSTSPFSCTAAFEVPIPTVTDNCSDYEVYTEIVTTVEIDVTNQYGQVIGTALDTVTVRVIDWDAPTRFVNGIPVGEHMFYYIVEDDCGNKTEIYCPFSCLDQIEPVAVCDDDLHVSIGGGDFARLFAADIDEGSWDNCEIDRIEVRRNKFDPINYTCGNSFSLWGPYVDFFCCDVGVEIEIQLRVIDIAGNINTCWLYVTPEEKVNPYCYAPHNVMVDCDEVPFNFDPYDTDQLEDLFGTAIADDNCEAEAEELPPVVDLDCGSGRIIRRFRAVDIHGNQSTNFCQQIVDIKEVHNYEIKFPEDAEALCGIVEPDSVTYEEIACDLLAVSHTDEFFSASGDECYKIFRKWKVINWCEYDGESAPMVIGRDEDCDGQPGDECVWVLRRPNGYTYIDRDNDETEPNNVPLAFQNICQGWDDFWRKEGTTPGYYEYTQIIKVYDDIDPAITGDDASFCSYDNVDCDAPISLPFSVDENCTPEDLNITVFLDAGADGVIDVNLTATGAYSFTLTGTYPDYVIGGVFPIGCHVFEVQVEDGCGNVSSGQLNFCVEDCKAPSPICINGLAIELMPFDSDGDNVPDEGMMAIWASDFIASPITDCSEPIKYSINRSGEAANIDSTGLTLTCADTGILVIEIWAWDAAGNSDFCETYILVQDNMGVCGISNPGIAGAVETEYEAPVENVMMNLSGQSTASILTGVDGSYGFDGLAEGYDYTITPERDGDYLNGVSTFDLVLISQHILGVQLLDSPYKMIAADVNNSESVTTLDLIALRKLILSIDTEFTNNTSWRFVDADYVFPDPVDPWSEDFPEVININNLIEAGSYNNDFIAVKIGDVTEDAQTSSLQTVEGRTVEGTLYLQAEEISMKAGQEYSVNFSIEDLQSILGYQATLNFSLEAIELVDIIEGVASEDNFGFTFLDEGLLTTSWHQANVDEQGERIMFTLVLKSKVDVHLSEVMSVSSRITKAEAYATNNELMDVGLSFGISTPSVAIGQFELYQNQPNPANGETLIGFNLPEATTATLTISDITGKQIKLIRLDAVKGYNSVVINTQHLPKGVLQYTIKASVYTDTKSMLITE